MRGKWLKGGACVPGELSWPSSWSGMGNHVRTRAGRVLAFCEPCARDNVMTQRGRRTSLPDHLLSVNDCLRNAAQCVHFVVVTPYMTCYRHINRGELKHSLLIHAEQRHNPGEPTEDRLLTRGSSQGIS